MKRLSWRLRAFTMVELLVVIAIIGILSGLVAVSVGPIQRKSRDAQRKTDLQVMRTGLETFKSDAKIYPNYTYFLGKNSAGSAVNANFELASALTDCQNDSYGPLSGNPTGWAGFATSVDYNSAQLRQGFASVNALLLCLKTTEKFVQDPQTETLAAESNYQYRVSYDYANFLISAQLENLNDPGLEALTGDSQKRYYEGNGKTNRQLANSSVDFANQLTGGAVSQSSGYYFYQCSKGLVDSVSQDLDPDQRSSSTYQPLSYNGSSYQLNSNCTDAVLPLSFGNN